MTTVAKGGVDNKSVSVITYVPLGERDEISLTLSRVKQFLCTPTKSGKMPSDEQVMKFMMLCKAQSLNPWVDDAYLVGYDSKDGPTFSLITAHKALLKRAEASHEYDGMESGVIILRENLITERPGDLVLRGETLVGGWSRVYRKDRSIPSYDSLNLETFHQHRSRWNADPAGMIVKCAEASSLRKAFPSTLGAMFCREEMERALDMEPQRRDPIARPERIAERMTVPAMVPTTLTDSTQSSSSPFGVFALRIDQSTSATEMDSLLEEILVARQQNEIDEKQFGEIQDRFIEKQSTLK